MTDLKNYRDASCPEKASPQGFSLMEVMLVIILLALAVVPMLESFSPSLNALNQAEQSTVFKHQALWTLNRVLALDYGVLESNSSDTDPVNLEVLLGSAEDERFIYKGELHDPPEVTIEPSDQDQDDLGGLLEITVSLGSVSLQTLKAEH